MYAIILSGGKQYKVKEGDVVKLEKLESGAGDKINFDNVLMVADGEKVTLGTPYVAKAKVSGEVVEQARHKKVKILKFRRRQNSMRRQGHRQHYTAVKITGIKAA